MPPKGGLIISGGLRQSDRYPVTAHALPRPWENHARLGLRQHPEFGMFWAGFGARCAGHQEYRSGALANSV